MNEVKIGELSKEETIQKIKQKLAEFADLISEYLGATGKYYLKYEYSDRQKTLIGFGVPLEVDPNYSMINGGDEAISTKQIFDSWGDTYARQVFNEYNQVGREQDYLDLQAACGVRASELLNHLHQTRSSLKVIETCTADNEHTFLASLDAYGNEIIFDPSFLQYVILLFRNSTIIYSVTEEDNEEFNVSSDNELMHKIMELVLEKYPVIFAGTRKQLLSRMQRVFDDFLSPGSDIYKLIKTEVENVNSDSRLLSLPSGAKASLVEIRIDDNARPERALSRRYGDTCFEERPYQEIEIDFINDDADNLNEKLRLLNKTIQVLKSKFAER